MIAQDSIRTFKAGKALAVSLAIDSVLEHGATLWRGCSLDEAWFENAASADARVAPRAHFPKVSEPQGGYRGELNTLDLDQTITGPKPLPIHTDGLLSGAQVDIILLYAHKVSNCRGGQTVLVDQKAALDAMPARLRGPIEDNEFEYRIFDLDYFHDRAEDWHGIPTYRDFGRCRSLNLALPFAGRFSVERPSWDVRLYGRKKSEAQGYFDDLSTHLLRPAHAYAHQWRAGDLLVMDNQRTLHGRLPFESGDCRVLWRLQFSLPR